MLCGSMDQGRIHTHRDLLALAMGFLLVWKLLEPLAMEAGSPWSWPPAQMAPVHPEVPPTSTNAWSSAGGQGKEGDCEARAWNRELLFSLGCFRDCVSVLKKKKTTPKTNQPKNCNDVSFVP